jgi:hypothetical protein
MGKVSILISYLGCQLAYMLVIGLKFESSESSFFLTNGSCVVILAAFFGLLLQKSVIIILYLAWLTKILKLKISCQSFYK